MSLRQPRPLAAGGLVLSIIAGCAQAATPSVVTPIASGTRPPVATDVPTGSPTPSPSLTPVEAARADLAHLAGAMEQTHPDLFHDMTRADWQAAIDRLERSIPGLTDQQLMVEFMRLVALPSYRGGRDGHMGAFPQDDTAPPVFPLSLYAFADGLYVTRGLQPYAGLVGARVTAIADHPIAEVLATIDPLLPRDNRNTPENVMPRFLLMPDVLVGLGLLAEPGPVAFTLERDGAHQTVDIEPVGWPVYLERFGHAGVFHLPARPGAPWTSRLEEKFWWTLLKDSRTLFAQYNSVGTPRPADLETMLAAARSGEVRRVVLDLRHNPGGDNRTFRTLVDTIDDPAIDRPGRLFVVTSTTTFSAAGNLATTLEARTSATFVGEPMGGGLNLYGEGASVYLDRLPVPLVVPVPTYYWEFAPGDPRLTIEPDLPVPMDGSDYFSGRDRALERILAYRRR